MPIQHSDMIHSFIDDLKVAMCLLSNVDDVLDAWTSLLDVKGRSPFHLAILAERCQVVAALA
jgi:hypothetical protein